MQVVQTWPLIYFCVDNDEVFILAFNVKRVYSYIAILHISFFRNNHSSFPTPQFMFCFQVLPLHVVSATNYFGRIVDKQKDQYTILAGEINEYFNETSNRVVAQKVEKLALYGFCEKTVFHR